MTTTAVTPIPGAASAIATGGQAVVAVFPSPNGGFILNPLAPADQGISAAEPMYVDPVGPCATLTGNGTVTTLYPGQKWDLIPGQTTATYVNAATSGHKFVVVTW